MGPTCAKSKEDMIDGFSKWEVEGWLSSLMAAEDLYGDKKKLKAIRTLMQKKKADTSDIEERVSKKLRDTFGDE